MFWALGLRSHLKDSLHLQSETIFPGTLIGMGLGHFKAIEKMFGDVITEDTIVVHASECKRVKGQRFSGYLPDLLLLH